MISSSFSYSNIHAVNNYTITLQILSALNSSTWFCSDKVSVSIPEDTTQEWEGFIT